MQQPNREAITEMAIILKGIAEKDRHRGERP
jgi:hypothetical protein